MTATQVPLYFKFFKEPSRYVFSVFSLSLFVYRDLTVYVKFCHPALKGPIGTWVEIGSFLPKIMDQNSRDSGATKMNKKHVSKKQKGEPKVSFT